MGGKKGEGAAGSVISMADIARLAQVSKPTVSRVLSGSPLVTEATRQRVLKIAQDHGYAINRNAQRLRQTRSDTIAVVLDFVSHKGGRIGDPFIFELLAGVSEALSVRNLDLLLTPTSSDNPRDYEDQVNGRAVDGFVFLGQGSREKTLHALSETRVPFVVWGAKHEVESYCTVGSDNRLGGQLAGRYFVKCGRKNWLFIGNDAHREIRLRHEGLNEAAAEAGDVSVEVLAFDDMSYAATHEALTAYLPDHDAPDAIFTYSDTAGMAAIGAMREAGYIAYRDYALVGYNNIPPAEHFSPSLTTVEQETHLAGELLIDKLMQLVEGGRAISTVLPTRLIVRET